MSNHGTGTRRRRWISSLSLCVLLIGEVDAGAKPPAPAVCDEVRLCAQYNQKAIALYGEQKYAEALEQFRLAYAIVPSENLLLNIGRTLHFLNRYEEALDYYNRYKLAVSDLSPQEQEKLKVFMSQAEAKRTEQRQQFLFAPHRNAAAKKIQENQFQEALAELDQAAEVKQDPELNRLRGDALFGLTLYPEAIRAYGRYISYFERLSVEESRLVKGLVEESDRRLTEMRSVNPEPAHVIANYFEGTLGSLGELQTLCGDNARCLYRARIGSEQYEAGRFSDALVAFWDAYRAFPSAMLAFAISRALHRLGYLQQALDGYRGLRSTLSSNGATIEPARSDVATTLWSVLPSCIVKAQTELERRESLTRQGVKLDPLPPLPDGVQARAPNTTPEALDASSVAAARPREPIYRSKGLWLGLGGGLVGLALITTAAVLIARNSQDSSGTTGMNMGSSGTVTVYQVQWR